MSGPLRGEPPELWDPLVRVSHWVLAVVVIGNALITRGGSLPHVWLGWIAMAVLAARMVWGLVGPAEARFSAFPPSPRAAVTHLRELASGAPARYASHNPAGAIMIYALWASLAAVILTGLLMTQFATPMTIAAQKAAVASGDWSALAASGTGLAKETKHLLEEVHEVFANLMLILAVIHVGGVFIEGSALRHNLVRAMLTGPRRRTSPGE